MTTSSHTKTEQPKQKAPDVKPAPVSEGMEQSVSSQDVAGTLNNLQSARPETILRLQRVAGNRAVARALGVQSGTTRPVLQRQNEETGEDEALQTKPMASPRAMGPMWVGKKENSAGKSTKAILQTKLTVSEPGDEQEIEADQVSDQVMRMSDKTVASPPDEDENSSPAGNAILNRYLLRSPLQRSADDIGGGPVNDATQSRIEGMQQGGRPLPDSERDFFEPRMGVDLSNVRVHTDSTAVETSKELNARAYTVGPHVAFNSGEFQPSTTEGRKLLGHELTHVVQQGAAGNLARKSKAFRKADTLSATEATSETPTGDIGKSTKDAVSGASTGTQPKTNGPKLNNDSDDVLKKLMGKIEEAKSGQSNEGAGKVSPLPAKTDPKAAPADPKAEPKVDQAELEKKKAELMPEVKPTTEHVMEQKSVVEKKTNVIKEAVGKPAKPLVKPSNDAKPQGAAQKGAGKKGAEDPAAGAAQAKQAFAQAKAQPLPEAPAPVVPPMPVVPVDAGGKPLPGNPQLDMQVAKLAVRAQTLRAKGTALRARAAQERANADIIQGNIVVAQSEVARSEAGIADLQDNVAYRREVVDQSKSALEASEQKAEMVATEAPKYTAKSEENKAKSGPMAGEAKELTAQNAAKQPDDKDAAGKSQEQGAQLNKVASDLGSIDDAITQTKAKAESLGQEAAEAKQNNKQTQGKITATEATLAQTEDRIGQMKEQSAAAHAHLAGVVDGPAQVKSGADALDQQGLAAIQASANIEKRLQQAQQNYQQGARSVPAAKMGARRRGGSPIGVQRKAKEGAYTDRVNLNLGGQVSEALPSWLTGEEPESAEKREQARQKEEERRQAEINEINTMADGNFDSLSAADKAGIALSLTSKNLFAGVAETNWPNFAGKIVQGFVDPRVSLMGIVSGLSMTLSGAANLFSTEQWAKDPVGNLLKSAADIATGIAITLGAIAGLAMAIIVILTAAAILSFGALGPLAAVVIPFCTTVATTVGGWTITAAAIAAGLQGLVLIKSLVSAATASSAKELQTHSDEMTEDAKNMGNMAMQVGVAKVMEAGGKMLGGAKTEVVEPVEGASVNEPVANEPVANEPVANEPVANEPVANEPVANEPVANEPVANEPVANEPVANEPVANEPVANEPVKNEHAKQTEPVEETEPAEESKPADPTTEKELPEDQMRRYKRYEKTKRAKGEEPLSPQEWYEKIGKKPAPNPYGQGGDPASKAEIARLRLKAESEFPNDIIHEGTSIKEQTGINRRPDVWVEDAVTGEVKKVYEAAKTKSNGDFVDREMVKKAEYDAIGLPNEFGNSGPAKR